MIYVAVAAAGIVGPACGNGADGFAVRDLAMEIRQDRAIAFSTGRERDRADVGCDGVHGQYEENQKTVRGTAFPTIVIAQLALSLNTMLPGLPFLASD